MKIFKLDSKGWSMNFAELYKWKSKPTTKTVWNATRQGGRWDTANVFVNPTRSWETFCVDEFSNQRFWRNGFAFRFWEFNLYFFNISPCQCIFHNFPYIFLPYSFHLIGNYSNESRKSGMSGTERRLRSFQIAASARRTWNASRNSPRGRCWRFSVETVGVSCWVQDREGGGRCWKSGGGKTSRVWRVPTWRQLNCKLTN